jgi:ribosome-associated protein
VKLETLPHGVRLAVEAAQEKKAAAVTVLDLSEAGAFTEYFVICTGFSTPQVQAICTEIEEQLYKHMGRSPEHREGHRSAEWALLDFGGFVVHVFSEQARKYYDLERLWRSAPKLEIAEGPGDASGVLESGRAAIGRGHYSEAHHPEHRHSEHHQSSRGHGHRS